MNVGQLKQLLNGWKDDAPVLMEDFTMREVHEVKSASHAQMCEWIEQQTRDVCVLSINERRGPPIISTEPT
jgi:hypothetical protein